MIIKTFLSAAALALVANSALAEGKLSVYHWFEYIPAELVEKFSTKYDSCNMNNYYLICL